MNWKDLINGELEQTYKATSGLLSMVDESKLDWKPATGENWMTTGQLLHHLTDACGKPIKGFVTGDWGLPPGADRDKMPPEEMIPPASKLPAVSRTADARAALEADRKLAFEMLGSCSEADLANRTAPAPWDPRPIPLGHRLLQMTEHLKQHKGQLFYYLKLQGKPVNTGHLWGM